MTQQPAVSQGQQQPEERPLSQQQGQGQEKHPQKPKTAKGSLDANYPGLNSFKYGIGYLEQALNIASEPLLATCFVIAVIDVMTGGHLMEVGLISYLWAAALAIGVTANFIITWRRSATALRLNRYGASIVLAVLGVLLGMVDCAALAIKGLQQMLQIPFVQALAWLSLNPVLMVYIRSIVAVSLLVVVALSNHIAITTAQAPKRRLTLWENFLNTVAPIVQEQEGEQQQQMLPMKGEPETTRGEPLDESEGGIPATDEHEHDDEEDTRELPIFRPLQPSYDCPKGFSLGKPENTLDGHSVITLKKAAREWNISETALRQLADDESIREEKHWFTLVKPSANVQYPTRMVDAGQRSAIGTHLKSQSRSRPQRKEAATTKSTTKTTTSIAAELAPYTPQPAEQHNNGH